eukprot:gnl/TRDRNA2_/TRDRNA2_81025_c0_seq1.p1 gnl/TRDRNA2_/TRDRNA2_81025_c0~~gnl/TRDRNA2_/TRDRNA2_81025_c0_seq1.p1  ORF type:complete len:121 (+),score=39.39 gnl/TRDRNA2_/TRDRNA2_81025_c0_seq1:68-430(+)
MADLMDFDATPKAGATTAAPEPTKQKDDFLIAFDPLNENSASASAPASQAPSGLNMPASIAAAYSQPTTQKEPAAAPVPAGDAGNGLQAAQQAELMRKVQEDAAKLRGNGAVRDDPFAGL